MGLKIFQQLSFGLFVLLLGQISIQNQTIGARFLGEIKRAGGFLFGEVKKARIFNDALEIKQALDKKMDQTKVVKAGVADEVEKAKDAAKEVEKKLVEMVEQAKKERLGALNEDLSDDFEDEAETSVSATDQDTILKNLP